ncbi:hypothetical protein H0H92_001633 [Tricholoma furcatifolium]|nr:hypothetical protein H0H92_001633 [Tricholoma furcatifolium]
MPDLLYDVWLIVGQFMSESELPKLSTFNRAFLKLALDEKYRVIDLYYIDEKVLRCLHRLQVPDIAARVRTLTIRVVFLMEVLHREKLTQEEAILKLNTSVQKITQQFKLFRHRQPRKAPSQCFTLASRHNPNSDEGLEPSSSTRIRDLFFQAIGSMVNLTECGFIWGSLLLDDQARDLLFAMNQAFPSSLTQLTLQCYADIMDPDIGCFLPLASRLQKLYLDIRARTRDGYVDTYQQSNQKTLVTLVAPFLNSLTSLRHLKIMSRDEICDLRPLLDAIGFLPKLCSFALDMSDATSISKILCAHQETLTTLDISSHYWKQEREYHRNIWDTVGRQLVRNPAWLRGIKTLKIPAFKWHSTTVAVLRHLSEASGCTLQTLDLTDIYIDADELEEALLALGPSRSLRNLSLCYRSQLSVSIFLLLERNLPGLHRLTLDFVSVSNSPCAIC